MKPSHNRPLPLLALALLGLGVGLRAPPAAAKERVALLPLQGAGAEGLEKILVQTVPFYLDLIPLPQVDRAIEKQGAELPVSAQQHRTLARHLNAVALVGGRVSQTGPKSWRLRLSVRQGSTGSPLAALDFAGRNRYELAVNVRRKAPRALRDAVAGGNAPAADSVDSLLAAAPAAEDAPAAARPEPSRPPPDPEPPRSARPRVAQQSDDERPPPGKSARRAEEPDAEVAARPDRPPAAPLLELSLGPKVMSRAFIYTDNAANLPGYTLPAAAGVSADAELYPAARSKSAARNFGLAGLWEASMGARTKGRDGEGITTRNNLYRIGARYRVQWPSFALSLGTDYGQHRFDALIEDAIAPNVVYTLLRPSLGFRALLGSGVSLGLTGAYLHVLNVGDLGDRDRFPRLTVKGAEVNALVGYALDADFDIRLQADLRHYAHAMNVKPGDPLPVGGALDEHFGASLLIRYLLR